MWLTFRLRDPGQTSSFVKKVLMKRWYSDETWENARHGFRPGGCVGKSTTYPLKYKFN